MDLEDLYNRVALSDISILERVDEYTLYCFYLGFEPYLRTKYNSPIRSETNYDSNASFSIFLTKKIDREFFWKDSATGQSGDIFSMIRKMFRYATITETYQKIDFDFKLGFSTKEPPKGEKIKLYVNNSAKPEAKIRVKSKDFTLEDKKYWLSFGITFPTLEKYKVKSLQYFWMNDFQEVPNAPKGLAFSYQVLDKFKIYQPDTPLFKFRNNYTEQCLEGFAQLTYQTDTCVITKSTKDVMVLREYGYDAVSPRSENTPVPVQFLQYLHKRYKKIYVLFDNDMKHRGDLYQEPKIYVPLSSKEKDISDFRRAYGQQLTKDLLKTIIK